MAHDAMVDGLVFDVQRFSVHDGPGIRTTVFFKGCPLRCRWCQNPEGIFAGPELAHRADRCTRCGECARACPEHAIHLGNGHLDRSACDVCGACAPVCPNGALEVVGCRVSVPMLLQDIRRDLAFFLASGGGVTVSGGEPTVQMAFLGEFVRGLHREQISVGLQTCGAFSWSAFQPILGLFDFIHFDLKLADPSRHEQATGVHNRTIHANAARLVEQRASVTFRMPVVPGINDDPDNIRQTAALLHGWGVPRIRLLRYHGLGESKLARIASPLVPLRLAGSVCIPRSFDRTRELFLQEGIEVRT